MKPSLTSGRVIRLYNIPFQQKNDLPTEKTMKETEMYIHLQGLKLFAYHGVLPQENKVGAEYTINLSLKTDFSKAAENDRLEDTTDYSKVFDTVKKEMKVPSRLLEHVSYRIARHIFQDFPEITEIRIGLYKQNPPMGADCEQTGIESIYTKTDEI